MIICYKCGAEGHKSSECLRPSDCQYLNNEQNVMYRDSKAWKNCQRDFKHIIDFTKIPKIPTKKDKEDHEKKFPKGSATSSSSQPKLEKPDKNKKDCKWRTNDICNCTENNIQVSSEHMLLQENMSRPFSLYRTYVAPGGHYGSK